MTVVIHISEYLQLAAVKFNGEGFKKNEKESCDYKKGAYAGFRRIHT